MPITHYTTQGQTYAGTTKIYFSVGGGVSLDFYKDGTPTPVVTVPGVVNERQVSFTLTPEQVNTIQNGRFVVKTANQILQQGRVVFKAVAPPPAPVTEVVTPTINSLITAARDTDAERENFVPSRLSSAELSNKFAPFDRTGYSNVVAATGDSITAGSVDSVAQVLDTSWYTYFAAFSSGRAKYSINAGRGGWTSTQLLAALENDVITKLPRGARVVIAWGRNDSGAQPDISTTVANDKAAVNQIKMAGMIPVFVTLPPIGTIGGPSIHSNDVLFTLRLNEWRKRYAARNGFDCIDFYAVTVDPATGRWKSGYSTDGTHPTALGSRVMGKQAADQLAPRLPAFATSATFSQIDSINKYNNGLFQSINVDRPTGVAAAPAGYTSSVGSLAGFAGNAWTINRTDGAAATWQAGTNVGAIASIGSVGDILSFSCVVSATGLDATAGIVEYRIRFDGLNPQRNVAMWRFRSDVPGPVTLLSPETPIPAGATGLSLGHVLYGGACTSSLGQITVRNLTTEQILL